ncbi:MAG: efflux RND transporter periplasmic adaptor subunit [Acidimicrobiales bacterium]
MPKAKSGWGRSGHRRAVLVGGLVAVVLVGGAVAAWASVSGGSTGYRTGTVTRADIGTSMALVGDVQPVSDAAPSFQVGGKVVTVSVSAGQTVTAGQALATLDTTALSETVSSAQSTLSADEAKLVEDEENQSSASAASGASKTPSTSTTTTTVPSGGGTASNATITQDQTTLTQDEATLDTDQQKEGADLAQAQTDCTSANTGTPTGQATCEAGLQTVSEDEQQVSKDQTAVSKDETALAQALGTGGSSSSGGSGGTSGTGGRGGSGGTPGTSTTQAGQASAIAGSTTTGATLTADVTGNTGSGGTGSTFGGTGGTSSAGGSSSADTDTPEQIASDQAAIDTAEAQLTNAQQSLQEATLSSPIAGTVVSVGIAVGDTVSADSSTEIITIVGTKSYEVQATLDSSQIPSVKVGQSSSVEVDGVTQTLDGTVSQVGPVQSGDSGYTYPVVVSLPESASGIFSGSTADVNISTGAVSHVVAVPTSAVQTVGSVSYVEELDKGVLTRKIVKVGMVGDEYTQVLSGLSPGQSVVLADYAEPVPSSNTETNTFGGGLGGLGGGTGFGGGGFGGLGGAGTFRVQRVGGGGFGG